MTDEILFKYISGQTTPYETKDVQDWAEVSEDRKKELGRLKNIWIMVGLDNEIEHLKKEEEISHIWNIIQEINTKEQNKNYRLQLVKYAAAILLLISFSGSLGYFISESASKTNSEFTEIFVPKGERSTVVLPDGSTVQLNSDSHLIFRSSFSSGRRGVELEGEGFFNVTHDKSRPFIVETHTLQIEVLGTSFDVSSYPNDSIVTTFLQTGKVKINSKNSEATYLSPNEAFSYNKTTHESSKLNIQDQRFTDWTKGILTIKEETIGTLSKKLERRFNIHIEFGDEDVRNHMYTGSIKDEDLNTLLEALAFASSIQYKRNGDTVTLFSKQ